MLSSGTFLLNSDGQVQNSINFLQDRVQVRVRLKDRVLQFVFPAQNRNNNGIRNIADGDITDQDLAVTLRLITRLYCCGIDIRVTDL